MLIWEMDYLESLLDFEGKKSFKKDIHSEEINVEVYLERWGKFSILWGEDTTSILKIKAQIRCEAQISIHRGEVEMSILRKMAQNSIHRGEVQMSIHRGEVQMSILRGEAQMSILRGGVR